MLKSPDSGNCPHCGTELVTVRMWIHENPDGANDAYEKTNYKELFDEEPIGKTTNVKCTGCNYKYG